MYDKLPESVKQRVLDHLRADDFPAAKEIYDAWISNRQENRTACRETASNSI